MISPTKFYNDRIADYRDYRRKALVLLACAAGTSSILVMIPDYANHWALKALLGLTVIGASATGWTSAEILKSEWRVAKRFAHRRRVRARA